jgi:hypothetical protein
MILHQLRTDGSLSFGHISEVMPFIDHSLKKGESLEHLPSPRVFKTHLRYGYISRRPGKYIYVARDGRDVLISYFHMYQTWVNPGILFPDFFADFLSGKVQYGLWFRHVAEWESHREDPNVLFLRYEDLVGALPSCVERIARFLAWPIAPDAHRRIAERCGIEYMRKYEDKFAPELSPSVRRSIQSGSFICRGVVGAWREKFTREQELAFDHALRQPAHRST